MLVIGYQVSNLQSQHVLKAPPHKNVWCTMRDKWARAGTVQKRVPGEEGNDRKKGDTRC